MRCYAVNLSLWHWIQTYKLTWGVLKQNIFNPVFLKFSRRKSYRFEKNGHAVIIWKPPRLWILSSENDPNAAKRIAIESTTMKIVVRKVVLVPHSEGWENTSAKVSILYIVTWYGDIYIPHRVMYINIHPNIQKELVRWNIWRFPGQCQRNMFYYDPHNTIP